jgi:serine/threonine protein kinase
LLPSPPPYSEEALIAAFPEYRITVPELGLGSFKAAYRIVYAGGDAVLKVVKEPAVIAQEDEETALPPRFEREIEAMRKVVSPRIVKVLDGPATRDIDGQPHVWYLEPFYNGGTLKDRIGDGLSAQDASALGDALLEAVEALWDQARLVHRDIKPSNVVFGEQGPVLLDLGIALHADLSPLTNAFGFSPRTNAYAAPEQFDIRHIAPIDSRTDQFLVGIVVFEAATGTHPFLAGPENAYLARLRAGALDEPALATVGDDCMQGVLRRLLRPNPHERFRTAALARRAIQECAP